MRRIEDIREGIQKIQGACRRFQENRSSLIENSELTNIRNLRLSKSVNASVGPISKDYQQGLSIWPHNLDLAIPKSAVSRVKTRKFDKFEKFWVGFGIAENWD